MKRFLLRILSFFGIPIIILLAIYFITDPFKTLRPFSIYYYDETNRDYISSELFLKNNPKVNYNSFIFGSSRCCGFNTYHWKHYLPDNSRQFLFQGWGESLTGIEQKIDYIDKNGNDIANAIVVFDIPGSFSKKQLSHDVLSIKHYRFSGQTKFAFQAYLFFGFIQKPSKWFTSIKDYLWPNQTEIAIDTLSNDWNKENKDIDINIQPERDSLNKCSEISKGVLFKEIESVTDSNQTQSVPLLTEDLLEKLIHIKRVFDKHHTDYKIIISPAIYYTHQAINIEDLKKIECVFGKEKVFDYSGKNNITVDCYNFSDPNHFGLSVGWQIIEDIYHN